MEHSINVYYIWQWINEQMWFCAIELIIFFLFSSKFQNFLTCSFVPFEMENKYKVIINAVKSGLYIGRFMWCFFMSLPPAVSPHIFVTHLLKQERELSLIYNQACHFNFLVSSHNFFHLILNVMMVHLTT